MKVFYTLRDLVFLLFLPPSLSLFDDLSKESLISAFYRSPNRRCFQDVFSSSLTPLTSPVIDNDMFLSSLRSRDRVQESDTDVDMRAVLDWQD